MAENIYYKRLEKIWELLGYSSANMFASAVGYSRSEKINRLDRSENARPGIEIFEDILKKFPEVNCNWVITGLGEPILKKENDLVNDDQAQLNNQVKRFPCEDCIEKEKQISALEREISTLRAKYIDALEELQNKKDQCKCG